MSQPAIYDWWMLIRHATLDDQRALQVTAMRSFVDDPVMRWLYPDDATFLAPGGEVFASAMSRWIQSTEVWCTDDGAGVAVWIPPGRPEVDVTIDPPAPTPPDDLLERFEIIGAAMAGHTPDEPHWYLQLLGTHPDWQRRGIGARLMEVMFERAADDGLACYLETETVENVVYYRRHGFEVRSEWDIPTGPHMWGMYRPVAMR